MKLNHNRYLFLLSGLILFLASLSFIINSLKYKFPGNNYFPDHTAAIALIILLAYSGLVIFFGKENRASKSCIEILYFFIIMAVIAFATNAVQLTPFHPVDKELVAFESYFNVNLIAVMEWTSRHPLLKNILAIAYDTLPYQMSFLPLCVIVSGRFSLLRDYYFLLLTTTLIGFLVYYFFPTTAPASVLDSPLFSPEQIATGLKFNQIHNHIIPTTNEGGLIALPSFHTIWALLCVYLLKEWPIACAFLLIINCFLIAACVLLGWHYPIDVVAAFIIVGISYYILLHIRQSEPRLGFNRNT
ncbi:phosphatase PAP2 family protein [Legionella shakespearei]|uniref:Inositolphosphotransferase Aur1/Ipt1 domain-containing protein n=1 Tax=Legionella shakespearei DSM 23087 TaxID=1122169 RepID=A0A0W0Z5Y4_9GAMM|nr:phosphatase PAP2 family protein [Legionella shakespearei]KTD64572.1 hypothetical protein Lsha_0556 [Legionella shakespearei DSM 23087]